MKLTKPYTYYCKESFCFYDKPHVPILFYFKIPLSQRFSIVYINKWIFFCINVLTWHEQQTPYGFPMVVLHVFYKQSVLVILQKIKATYILMQTINTNTQGEGSSRLIVLLGFSCFFFNMLLVWALEHNLFKFLMPFLFICFWSELWNIICSFIL